MAYEDRDYFRSKPKFELSPSVHPATKGFMIAVTAAYVVALMLGNSTSFASAAFLETAGGGGPQLVERAVVLTQFDVGSWLDGFRAGHWKLLTHWLVPPDLLRAVLDVLCLFFAGRMVEELFGTRRFALLFVAACVASGLLAALTDTLVTGGRTSVVMGPSGGAFAAFFSIAWIAPDQRTILGWRMRPFVFGLVGGIAALSIVMGAVGSAPVVHSPTQVAWGATVAAAYMIVLKRRGRLPALAPSAQAARENDPLESTLAKARQAEEKLQQEEARQRAARSADQQKLDALLEKISREGIGALSRGEKTFLDEQARKRKG